MNQREEILKKLKEIYSEVLGQEIEDGIFEEGTNIIQKLHIDSLIALQIIVKIEKTFNTIIEDDSLAIELLDTVDKAIAYIEEKQEN